MSIIPKILIIDDDRFFREFYKAELSQYQFLLDFAGDGETGLQKAATFLPSLILLDVILPKEDGFEVLKKLKSSPQTKNIPVIIISSLSSPEDMRKLKDLGAIGSFNKLVTLPNQVAVYIAHSFKTGFKTQQVAPGTVAYPTKLEPNQTNNIFKESLVQLESSLDKLFGAQTKLEDMNVSLIPFSKFKIYLAELSRVPGTIFIYGVIQGGVQGLSIMAMKRDNVMTLIKLIEKGTAGREMGLEVSDRVIEEFFNIIMNSFLTKLSNKTAKTLLLQSPTITNSQDMVSIVGRAQVPDNNLVVFLEEAYNMESLDLTFSLFSIFGEGLI